MEFINEDNRLTYIPSRKNSLNLDVYIEIAPGSIDSMQTIYVNIWIPEYNKLYFQFCSLSKYGYHKDPKNSKIFKKYPTLPNKVNYDNAPIIYQFQQKEIIDILEKFQILNPKYRNKQFKNITQKCIQG